MTDLRPSDSLAKYKVLIRTFIDNQITPADFEKRYLEMFKGESEIFEQDIFDILQDLFTSADGYVGDPVLRRKLLASNPDLKQYGQGLDDDELRSAARDAYRRLVER